MDSGAQPGGVVTRDGSRFVLDEHPYYYSGCNNYYLMVYASEPELRPCVDEILQEAAAMGLAVLRTWAFNDGAGQWNALQIQPGVYQEYVFQGLDYVLYRADQLGLRLILPFVNYWSDYGGMDQYVAWSPSAAARDDFYTDLYCRIWYQHHVAAVLNRVNTFNGRLYREDPAVFAWELANEPRCPSDPSGEVLTAWIAEMSRYVKSADPLHMVTTGSEGFYGPAGPAHNPKAQMGALGVDFVPQHRIATLDFATVHVWPDHWNLDYDESMQWVQDHIDDTGLLLGKPVIFEEFGKFRPLGLRNQYYQGWYDAIYSSAAAGLAAGGSNFWILYHDGYEDYDGFGVYFPADASTIDIITAEAGKMNALAVAAADPGAHAPGLALEPSFPNPFREEIRIRCRLDRPGWTAVDIFDPAGKRIRSLAAGRLAAGPHEFHWDGLDASGRPMAQGIYLFRIATEGGERSGRCVLVR